MESAVAAGRGKVNLPRIEARAALQLLAFFLGIALVQGLAVMAAWRGEGGEDVAMLPPVARQLTGGLAAWAALPIVQLACANAPGPRAGWARLLAVHAAGFLGFTAVKSLIMFGLRRATEPLIPGISVRQPLVAQLFWESQLDVVLYGCLAAFWTLRSAWEQRRAALLQAARLDSQLASARLDALTAQVNPHFLFNALNTVSAVMYEDLPRTERLLSNLGQILRATLAPGGASWSLADERAHTQRYLDILLARFGDRLSVRWQIPPVLDRQPVPRFALQTLVENAVKHNQDRVGRLSVTVSCTRTGSLVNLAVEDDGRGLDPAAASGGGGLHRLRETLRLLHGERARLILGGNAGARVELRLPARDGEA